MVCDVCKEGDVVITLTEIEGNGVRQVRLCEKCAAERGVQTSLSQAKPDVGSFLQAVQQHASTTQGDLVRCSFCSATLRDFRQSGRLGCQHCYGAFENNMRELLRHVHGSSRHVGRRYEAPSESSVGAAPSTPQLRERLRAAIEREQFELAATLRDQLRGRE